MSSVPAFCETLITELAEHEDLDGVQVADHWPGPDTEFEAVFLGEEITDWSSEIVSMKAGRKIRQETYTVTVECWVFGGDGLPTTAAATRDRAIALADVVDDLFADEPQIDSAIQWGTVASRSVTLHPFEKGWGAQATVQIEVNARLT